MENAANMPAEITAAIAAQADDDDGDGVADADNACWVELDFGDDDPSAYVNGVENKAGAFASVDQTGAAAPAIWGNKTFVNSYLHLKHDVNEPYTQLGDSELDAALQVDKRVTVGTSAEEIFAVKENVINLKTITNIKNIPHFGAGAQPPAAATIVTVNGSPYSLNSGDLYTYVSGDGHTILGVVG